MSEKFGHASMLIFGKYKIYHVYAVGLACQHVQLLESLKLFITFHWRLLSSLCGVAACIILLGNPLSSGCAGATEGMPGLQGCLGWMLCINWHPHECQDEALHGRTLHGSWMINFVDIHIDIQAGV